MRKKPETDYPKIVVSSLIQRASDLAVACRRDKKELCKAGFDWKNVTLLSGLIVKCSEKEAECRLQREMDEEETARLSDYVRSCRRIWKEVTEKARKALIYETGGIKVPGIRGGRSRIDLVQDLSDIAVFCRMNAANLKKGRFDFSLADRAARTAKELSGALAEAELRKSTPSEQVEQRNKVCRELYEAAMEVCRVGRTVFMNDSLRRKNYRSVQLP